MFLFVKILAASCYKNYTRNCADIRIQPNRKYNPIIILPRMEYEYFIFPGDRLLLCFICTLIISAEMT